MRRYKADLTDEIEPQINELLSRAEKGLQVLLKRESMLQAKVGGAHWIQSRSLNIHQAGASQTRPTSRAAPNTTGMNKLDVRRMQMLSRQRQKLEDEAAALQAEVDAMVILCLPQCQIPLTLHCRN